MIPYLNPIPRLPKPFGPHKVGTSEWEIPVSEIHSSTATPDPTISTIKFRLYYPTASSGTPTSIKWLPSPQRQWTEAYSSFLGLSDRMSSWLSALPSLLNYTTISAVPNAELLSSNDEKRRYPLVVFSHGLGGNFNTYSSICASLASFGIVCAAPEHRDGSAPISFVRSSPTEQTTSIPYQRYAHSPTKEVLDCRNSQLRIRLWELELLYTVLSSFNSGKSFTNYATGKNASSPGPCLKDSLDLQPGRVAWAGHSFGAATTVQFVKSVYYNQHRPSLQGTEYENDINWRPIYSPTENSELVKQITSSSPVALLDLWTMPLSGESTKWLWEKPMPCYEKNTTSNQTLSPGVISIISAEFHRYTTLLHRTKAVLSPDPARTFAELEQSKLKSEADQLARSTTTSSIPTPPNPNTTSTITSSQSARLDNTSPSSSLSNSSTASPTESRSPSPSPGSSTTSITASLSQPQDQPTGRNLAANTAPPPHLYLIPNSAHLSQSDFGHLFPNLTRYFMKAHDPQKTTELNVRAILAMMSGCGLPVEPFGDQDGGDQILSREGLEERFVRLDLGLE